MCQPDIILAGILKLIRNIQLQFDTLCRVGKVLPVCGKNRFFSIEKTVRAKIIFARWKKHPGKNCFCQVEKAVFTCN
jgi:hypothetical protein